MEQFRLFFSQLRVYVTHIFLELWDRNLQLWEMKSESRDITTTEFTGLITNHETSLQTTALIKPVDISVTAAGVSRFWKLCRARRLTLANIELVVLY